MVAPSRTCGLPSGYAPAPRRSSRCACRLRSGAPRWPRPAGSRGARPRAAGERRSPSARRRSVWRSRRPSGRRGWRRRRRRRGRLGGRLPRRNDRREHHNHHLPCRDPFARETFEAILAQPARRIERSDQPPIAVQPDDDLVVGQRVSVRERFGQADDHRPAAPHLLQQIAEGPGDDERLQPARAGRVSQNRRRGSRRLRSAGAPVAAGSGRAPSSAPPSRSRCPTAGRRTGRRPPGATSDRLAPRRPGVVRRRAPRRCSSPRLRRRARRRR